MSFTSLFFVDIFLFHFSVNNMGDANAKDRLVFIFQTVAIKAKG